MLKEAGNLLAYSGFPKGRRVKSILTGRCAGTFRAAARKGLAVVPDRIPDPREDRPGVLADVIAKLAAAKINVTACDAVAAGEGSYGAILWVKPQNVQKAARVLGAVKEERPQAAEVGVGTRQASAAGSAAA